MRATHATNVRIFPYHVYIYASKPPLPIPLPVPMQVRGRCLPLFPLLSQPQPPQRQQIRLSFQTCERIARGLAQLVQLRRVLYSMT